VKTVKSVGKVMATVFWDARSIIHILPSKQTINGDYYAALLDHFNNIYIKKKRLHLAKKKVLFHQDNAQFHTYYIYIYIYIYICARHRWPNSMNSYELLPHLAYSLDVTSCNYFLFPNLKKWFGGKKFTTREQLIAETEAYFEGLDKSYYSDGLKKLENRWIKCIELKGNYVEK